MRAAGRLKKAFPAWLGKKQICCVLAGLLLGGIAQAAGTAGTEGAAGELRRPGYGQEAGREDRADEIHRVYQQVLEELPERIRGGNLSLNQVRNDLNLISRMDEYGITLRWESEHCELVDSFGAVNAQDVPEGGAEVELRVELTDGRYPEQYVLPVRVVPEKTGARDLALEGFIRTVEEADRAQRESEWLKLPDTYNGAALQYQEPRESPFPSLAALGFAAAVLLTAKERSDKEKAAKQRENQLLMDYLRGIWKALRPASLYEALQPVGAKPKERIPECAGTAAGGNDGGV